MRIGYARVSTEEQNLDLQYLALSEARYDIVFEDRASGVETDRRGLAKALRQCGEGDVLIVWKLDRLGRSLFDLINLAQKLHRKGAGLKILTGQGSVIDTTNPEGRMMFGILASIADFERELIRDRTKAGIDAARRRGVTFGRPRKLSERQVGRARLLIETGRRTHDEMASLLRVHVDTLRRGIERYEVVV